MNKGKICVSVCAETADQLIEQIKRAADSAEVVEIRFDCLEDWTQIGKTRQFLSKNKSSIKQKLIGTFRHKEEGGKNGWVEINHQLAFWSDLLNHTTFDIEDLEFNPNYSENLRVPLSRIRSHHDFKSVPANLDEIYENLAGENPDVVKIAVQANDITDAIAVWKLLGKAKAESRQIIPIAMGESGRWTRILGLAHGAFMTYAALDAGSETALGQVSARDLTEVYRARELNEETAIYGIVGGNTSYSMSPYIHNAAFKFHRLNAVFVPLQVKNLDEFMRRMVQAETREIELNFKGFAVTIPHKQNVVKHLDFVDETAQKIGAVNTVRIDSDGELSGYNTDAQGFIEPLQNSFGDLKNARVAVFGAGGASRAVCYALKKVRAEVTVFARNTEKAERLKTDFGVRIERLSPEKSYKDFDILVNATPLGTKGEMENETPAAAAQIENVKLVYDLIYNPFETKLIQEAKKAYVPTLGGLSMLIAQAKAQQKIWTGRDAPMKEMSAAALQRLS